MSKLDYAVAHGKIRFLGTLMMTQFPAQPTAQFRVPGVGPEPRQLVPLLCRAEVRDHDLIVGLIDAAAEWLRGRKQTDQWAQPWRNQEDRSHRIRRDLAAAKTWILWDGRVPAATITADPEDCPIWPPPAARASRVRPATGGQPGLCATRARR